MINSLIARFLTAMVLTTVFFYLYRSYKEEFLKTWAIAWFFYSLNYMNRFVFGELSIVHKFIAPVSVLVIVTFILLGSCTLAKVKIPKLYYYIIGFVISYSFIFKSFEILNEYDISTNLSFIIFAGGLTYSGIIFIITKNLNGNEKHFAGLSLILLGLINFTNIWSGQRGFFDDIIGHIGMVLQLVLAVSIIVVYFVESQWRINELNKKLENAMTKVISGFIPICSHCKSVRLEDDTWISIEKFVDEHSDAKLTHGICTECSIELYPGLSGNSKNDSV